MKKEQVLIDASNLIAGQRAEDYGSVDRNFANIAAMWSVLLEKDITAAEVALCMAAVKMCRLINTPSHEDSWIDLAGYAAIGGEVSE